MMEIQGIRVDLRLLDEHDLDFLVRVENDSRLWELSARVSPYSIEDLQDYISNAQQDIYEAQQLRLVITTKENRAVGFIDLFDFEPLYRRVGVGIIIYNEADRGRGYASESLAFLCSYAFEELEVKQVFANITDDNDASIQLFEKAGFVKTGTKVAWIKTKDGFKNESLYQLF